MDLERLLDTWRGPLVGLLAAWGTPWPEALTLAEEVFSQAWLSRHGFAGDPRDRRRVGAWLRGIARNLYLAWLRERRRPGAAAGGEAGPEPAARRPYEPDPRTEALRAAIDGLPPPLREVVYMHYLEQNPVRDVAALLGVGEKTVEGRLYRARAALRRRLELAATAQEVRR